MLRQGVSASISACTHICIYIYIFLKPSENLVLPHSKVLPYSKIVRHVLQLVQLVRMSSFQGIWCLNWCPVARCGFIISSRFFGADWISNLSGCIVSRTLFLSFSSLECKFGDNILVKLIYVDTIFHSGLPCQ